MLCCVTERILFKLTLINSVSIIIINRVLAMGIGDRFKKLFKSDKSENEDFKTPKIEIPHDNDEIIEETYFKNPAEEAIEINDPDSDSDDEPTCNFEYLNDLIKSDAEEIVLNSDIVLDPNFESGRFEYGIRIERDSITIDGKGHTIDALGRCRIFFIIRGNVVLKNIVFKNALGKHKGGAIELLSEDAKVLIRDCTFENNSSEGFGGAIGNRGDLTVRNSRFLSNDSEYDGAAIYNESKLGIDECIFERNGVYGIGGTGIVYTEGPTNIKRSSFTHNYLNSLGGLICIDAARTVLDSCDISHSGYVAAYNKNGCVKLKNCKIHDISAKNIIYNNNRMEIHNCCFSDNEGENTVYNSGIASILAGQFLDVDIDFGVSNHADCIICGANFNENTSKIYNSSKMILDDVKIVNSLNSIVNEDELIIRNVDGGFTEKIDNRGTVDEGGCRFTFSHLNRMICESQVNEVVLECDIHFDELDEIFYPSGIELDMDDIIIDGNGHAIDAHGLSRIFKIMAENIIVKNIILENGRNNEGGAIFCCGQAKILNSTFKNNNADDGGAIYNINRLEIVESTFSSNNADMYGGAIYNGDDEEWGTKIDIRDSVFSDNVADEGAAICSDHSAILNMRNCSLSSNCSHTSGSAIDNSRGSKMSIDNCNFSENGRNSKSNIISNVSAFIKISDSNFACHEKAGDIIYNAGTLELLGVDFKENVCKSVIRNFNDSTLTMSNGVIGENDIWEAVLLNNGKFCSINNVSFENNRSENVDFKDIYNQSRLSLKHLKSLGKILNEGDISIKDSPDDLADAIEGDGSVKTFSIPSGQSFNFEYLDVLIHESQSNEIILDNDICLDGYEAEFYEGGLELDRDGLVIDGNGRTIDGGEKSRIFLITGNNITLKNIIFKNGQVFSAYNSHYNNHGGAIRINGADLTIENCKFINNKSEGFGGAISKSCGKLEIYESSFENNKSTAELFDYHNSGKGGAIINISDNLFITGSVFNKNNASSGGALFNQGVCEIIDSSLNDNEGLLSSAICNNGNLKIKKTIFHKNSGGAVVRNQEKSETKLSDCILSENKSSYITIDNEGEIHIINTTLKDNEPDENNRYFNSSSQYAV